MEKKISIPFSKVASFVAKLIISAKDGISKSEAEMLLAEFLVLLAEVLKENS